MALTVSASTGSKDIMMEVWSIWSLIPSLHDTIDPIHHGPLLVDLFLILSLCLWVNNIFWVNIFTASGQGSQMAADGVWVGGLPATYVVLYEEQQ